MSELISGKEALIALANGEDVEYRVEDFTNDWNCAKSLKVSEISSGMVEIFDSASDENPKYCDAYFRLKPRTITINEIEVPAPLSEIEQRKGVVYYLNDGFPDGYALMELDPKDSPFYIGAWRTEDEINQVVAALRTIFK